MIDPLQTRLEREFKHTSPLMGCRFDPYGRFLFVTAQDDSIQRFDLLLGKKTPFLGHESWLRGLAFTKPELKPADLVPLLRASVSTLAGGVTPAYAVLPALPFSFISGDYHGKLIWWQGDHEKPAPIRTVDAHIGWIRAVAVSPDGKTVASCGNDHLVKLWSIADGKLLQTLEGHASHVYNVAFHPAELNRLVSGDLKGILKDWDLQKGTVVRELDAKVLHKFDSNFMADHGGIRGMAFDAAGGKLACTGITNVSNAFAGIGNPLVLLFNWKDGKSQQLKPKEAIQGTGWGVAIHRDGFVIGAGGASQGKIWFWKPEEAASFHTINVPVNVRDMALSPDGTRIAVACSDGSAKVYTMIANPLAKK
jgi:WD40 repeat protein